MRMVEQARRFRLHPRFPSNESTTKLDNTQIALAVKLDVGAIWQQ